MPLALLARKLKSLFNVLMELTPRRIPVKKRTVFASSLTVRKEMGGCSVLDRRIPFMHAWQIATSGEQMV
jgi:hypothetical protein